MKICLIAVNFWKNRGEGRVNYEVAMEAIGRGHEVTLVARNVAPELLESSYVNWVKIPKQRISIQILSYTEFCYQATRWLDKHRAEYDLVHVSEARLWTGADVFTSHFLFDTWQRSPFHPWQMKRSPRNFYHLIFAKWFSFWQTKLFPATSSLVAVSETLRQELAEIGINPSKIETINNGVELEEFYPGTMDRKTLNLPVDVPLVLFVGDIKLPRKNLETLLQALKLLPEVHLAVAGRLSGSPYPKLVKQMGLSDRVYFLGFRRDIAEIMRSVDLFVVPSRYDTFGLVVLEAMASGLPVITTKAMGVSALVTPESGIVLSNTEDVEALAAAISKIVADPNLSQTMGKAGVKIAQCHSWKSTASKYLALFERQYLLKQPISDSELLEVN